MFGEIDNLEGIQDELTHPKDTVSERLKISETVESRIIHYSSKTKNLLKSVHASNSQVLVDDDASKKLMLYDTSLERRKFTNENSSVLFSSQNRPRPPPLILNQQMRRGNQRLSLFSPEKRKECEEKAGKKKEYYFFDPLQTITKKKSSPLIVGIFKNPRRFSDYLILEESNEIDKAPTKVILKRMQEIDEYSYPSSLEESE